MIFYLGTHRPAWLERTAVPLFVSRVTMPKKTFPRALGPWALDSGGFSEIAAHGRWTIEPEAYADEVRTIAAEVGNMRWAAIQDWMCEDEALKKTGLTIEEHQRRTLESYLKLRELAPEIPWAPVLQGWLGSDYQRHWDAFEAAGVDLRRLPVVGVGTMCRRQNALTASFILADLRHRGLTNLHGFGFKVDGLTRLAETAKTFGAALPFPLASADSLAWSYQARRERPLDGCSGHKNCANCLRFALDWRARLLASLERATGSPQRMLFGVA